MVRYYTAQNRKCSMIHIRWCATFEFITVIVKSYILLSQTLQWLLSDNVIYFWYFFDFPRQNVKKILSNNSYEIISLYQEQRFNCYQMFALSNFREKKKKKKKDVAFQITRLQLCYRRNVWFRIFYGFTANLPLPLYFPWLYQYHSFRIV